MKDHIDNLEIIQSYPLFKANQVLRENQLNDVVKYLEQQDRLSRICLMGTGIVCGLNAHWDAVNSVLVVSQGIGVTSEGYLVKCDGKSFPAYRSVNLNLKWFGAGEESLEIDLNDVSTPQVWELEGEIIEDEDQEKLTQDALSGKVLVVVLESQTDEGQGLCGNDCDEKGISRNFLTHFLLMDGNIADKILQATYDPSSSSSDGTFANMNELFYFKFSAVYPVIERFGFKNDNTVKLNDIITYEIFIERYQLIIKNLSARLNIVFNEVNKIFSPVFVPMLVTGEKLVDGISLSKKIDALLGNEHYKLNIQYLHDFLCDLVHAYGELMESIYDLVADCPPDTHRYPKFIWIRSFLNDENESPFSIYRTPYTQPPVYNSNKNQLSETITLYEKLKTLVNGEVFQVPDNRDDLQIRITPGKSDTQPLSERSVPFYYNNHVDIVNHWSPRLKRLGKAGKVYSYYRSQNKPFDDPLLYRMEGCDFLRIEGHIGKSYYEVISRLTDFRQHYNLSFEMVALKIGEKFDDDLFQFICEDMDCDRQRYADQYASLRNSVFSAFQEGDFPDALTQILPDDLKDFKYDDFSEKYDEIITEHQRENLPSSDEFGRINDCYIDLGKRWQAFKNKHLFHHFALDHPGMEHRGGVPLGGTFILAYIDSEDSQSRTVVADFYLPYSCVSGCVPTSIIAQRPRPVLRVSPSVFCEGETDPTELEIKVQPEGGIITGPGYTFDQGRHLFTPSESGINEGEVELKYYIDGGEATYNLTIVKRPEAGFTIINEKGEEVSKICQDGGKLTLKLASGESEGQFTVWHGEEELTDFIEDENDVYILDPMEFHLETGEPITLLVRYAARGNLCDNQSVKELTIFPFPDAGFSFEGQVDEVCVNNTDRIELLPNQEGGYFSAHIENSDPIPGLIQQEQGKWYIHPSAIDLGPGQKVRLAVLHNITNEHDCGDSSELQFTIWRMQAVHFNLPDQICKNDLPIPLNPQPKGGTFEYKVEGIEVENLIEKDQFYPNRIQATSPIDVEVLYAVNAEEGVCTGTSTKSVKVLPVPEVDFEARFIGGIENPNQRGGLLISITNVQPEEAEKYVWESNSVTLASNLEKFAEDIPREPIEFDRKFDHELWIALSVGEGICNSDPVRKNVMPTIDLLTLYIISSETDIPSIISDKIIPLQKETVINKSRHKEPFFVIRATTIPESIFSVEFVLTRQEDTWAEKEVKINEANNGYDLSDDPNPGFKFEPGSYLLKATPKMNTENGDTLAGLTTEIPFSIANGEVPRGDVTRGNGLELTDDLINFLRRRDTTYRNEMAALGAGASLARTVSFQKTEAFLNAPSDSLDFEGKYFDLVDTLEKAAKRTDIGGERQGEFFKLMEVATKHFMDREIVKSPDHISEEILSNMTEKIARFEEIGFDREALTSNWAAESLKKELNAPVTESFEKAITKK